MSRSQRRHSPPKQSAPPRHRQRFPSPRTNVRSAIAGARPAGLEARKITIDANGAIHVHLAKPGEAGTKQVGDTNMEAENWLSKHNANRT